MPQVWQDDAGGENHQFVAWTVQGMFLLVGDGGCDCLWTHLVEAPPEVVYAQLKFMWEKGGKKEESLQFVRQFAINLANDIEHESSENGPLSTVSETRLEDRTRLLARCYLKQGQWQKELKEDWDQVRRH